MHHVQSGCKAQKTGSMNVLRQKERGRHTCFKCSSFSCSVFSFFSAALIFASCFSIFCCNLATWISFSLPGVGFVSLTLVGDLTSLSLLAGLLNLSGVADLSSSLGACGLLPGLKPVGVAAASFCFEDDSRFLGENGIYWRGWPKLVQELTLEGHDVSCD